MSQQSQGSSAFRRMPLPEELEPGDYWAYWCRICNPRMPLQGGWVGVLAHFAIVHPDLPEPPRPVDVTPPEPPQRHLTSVEEPARPTTRSRPRQARTRAHTASQPALFELDPEDT